MMFKERYLSMRKTKNPILHYCTLMLCTNLMFSMVTHLAQTSVDVSMWLRFVSPMEPHKGDDDDETLGEKTHNKKLLSFPPLFLFFSFTTNPPGNIYVYKDGEEGGYGHQKSQKETNFERERSHRSLVASKYVDHNRKKILLAPPLYRLANEYSSRGSGGILASTAATQQQQQEEHDDMI